MCAEGYLTGEDTMLKSSEAANWVRKGGLSAREWVLPSDIKS